MTDSSYLPSTADVAAAVEGMVAAARGALPESLAPADTSALLAGSSKRKLTAENKSPTKTVKLAAEEGVVVNSNPKPIPRSKEGISEFRESDVLSGRGGGTNVHPGNRTFRDLINLYRRTYLKARKNDKPAISRMIVRAIREQNGRFLKKDEKSGLWFEIGDDAAREKTSQALRQRAPEMRRLLFETEREEARLQASEQFRQQQAPNVVYHPSNQQQLYTVPTAVQAQPTDVLQMQTYAALFPATTKHTAPQPVTNNAEVYAQLYPGTNTA